MTVSTDLHEPLRRFWGYDEFRPLQERVIQSILGGHDTCVVMPTGGGKSLCYQLPALVSQGTAVVISPLIALMQDQVAQLTQMGIPATVLNSSVSWQEQSNILAKAAQGAYRLLYLSPERLAKPETVAWLARVPVRFFAIDEAHCISEWGHEFRPEYRQLSSLRANFPDKPIAAFTASATRRVRHDILAQLQLQDPHKYIQSFHRPNLRYLVKECKDDKTQRKALVTALREHKGDNVIVYAPTIARVEEMVDYLAGKRIAAIPYHAKMDVKTRQRNQERWMSDEVRVLVGTIAFGLGINKAAVRAVIHISLPKSLEQYYQEAGRAGRDGLPSNCLLLWRKKDAGLLAHFIEQIEDGAEKQRAWDRYHVIRRYAESSDCRHRQVCLHFGETPKWQRCEMCDVCGATPEWLEESEEEATLTVERKREPRRRADRKPAAIETPYDPELLEYMREWRRGAAQRDNIPAFMVTNDATLEDLCWKLPRTLPDLLRVTGIGERKAATYGAEILAALKSFHGGARAAKQEAPKSLPAEETLQLLRNGRTFEEIAQIRERRLATVVDLVANMVERGMVEFDEKWIHPARRQLIETAVSQHGIARLKLVKEALPEDFTYGEIRLIAAKTKLTQASR